MVPFSRDETASQALVVTDWTYGVCILLRVGYDSGFLFVSLYALFQPTHNPHTFTALPVTVTFFLGHLGSDILGASALSSMWCNALGFAIIIGLAMGLESLAPHAHGASNPQLVGLLTQRALAITLVACVPVAGLWCLNGIGVKAMGVPESTANISLELTLWRIPGLPATAIFECLRRYVVAQNLVWPTTVACAVVVFVWHIPATWFLVHRFGYLGSSFSITISQWLMVVVLVIVILVRERFVAASASLKPSWPRFVFRDVFSGWKQYLSFAMPAMASLFVEWGGYELYAALSSRLGKTALATHSIMNATTAIWYMAPVGLGTAAATLLGNYLGQGKAREAKSIVMLTYILLGLWGVLNGGLGMIYRNYWGALFSDDPDVISMTASLFPILWAYEIVDCLKCGGVSLLRGTGRPGPTMWGNALSLVVGFLMALFLGLYLGYGMPGIWWGLTISWGVASFLYILLLYRTDWDQEVINTAQELQRTHHRVLDVVHGDDVIGVVDFDKNNDDYVDDDDDLL